MGGMPPTGTMGIQNYTQVYNPRNPVRLGIRHRGEVGLKPPRVKFANTEHNEETLRLNLDLLENKREQVLKRTEDYQRKTARYYDRKVRPNSFKPGDLGLKKLLPVRKDPAHGKLGPNWEGPYIVSRVIRPGNYKLQTEEGMTLQHP